MNTFITGGWSQSLTGQPLKEFDVMMYGMVTNLDGLTTGTSAHPGWSPEKQNKPDTLPGFKGKTLWVYGGGGCSPQQKPANEDEVLRIVEATVDRGWDGVDFDDECNMNTERVIEAMKRLKEARKETSLVLLPAIPTIIPIRKMVKSSTRKSEKSSCQASAIALFITAMPQRCGAMTIFSPMSSRH